MRKIFFCLILVSLNLVPALGFIFLIACSVMIGRKILKEKIYLKRVMKIKELIAESLYILILFMAFIISVSNNPGPSNFILVLVLFAFLN
jgi:hypothetical protein